MKKLNKETMTMSKWFNDVFEIRETKDGSKLFIKGPESLEDINAIYEHLKSGVENGGAAFFLDKKVDKLKKSLEAGYISQDQFNKWTAVDEDGRPAQGSMAFIKYTSSIKID